VLLYNTKELPDGGPADLADLTQPQWKGKVVMDNPALGGPGGLTMAAMKGVIGADGWQAWLKALKANDIDLTDSSSSSYDAVVRGERPLCICSYHDFIGQAAGTPVGVDFYNQDNTGVIPQAGTMVVSATAPHPAMAALWLNWVLSQDGGQAAVAASGRTPTEENVPGADKVGVPAGKKVASFSVLTDYINNPDSYNDVFKSIFGS
jgi:ABC-type Fe3+ transport system substrate-binding protein